MNLRLILSALLACSLSFAQYYTTAHDYLQSRDNPQLEFKFEEFKALVEKMYDVNALNVSGANLITSLLENWSYKEPGDNHSELTKTYIQALEYLINKGVSVSNIDYRGLSAMYYVLRWGPAGNERDAVVDILLANKTDLNLKSYEGFGLVYLLSREADLDILLRFLDHGLKLNTVDLYERNFVHISAMSGGKDRLPVEELLKRYSEKKRKALVHKKTDMGFSPLHFAAMKGNLKGVKYLLENYSLNVNDLTKTQKTALDLAKDAQSEELITYLESQGAKYHFYTPSTFIKCNAENNIDLNYEVIVQMIKECRIKRLKDLLKILPASYKSHNTKAYFTLAVQSASAAYPQIVTFGKDGKLLMAFNGHKSQRGFYNLEIIQYRDDERKFELRDIEFPKTKRGTVKFSEKNPLKCLSCHGDKPRPLWDSWHIWPGKFQSESSSTFPKEQEYLAEFKKNRKKGRYKYIPRKNQEPLLTHWGPSNAGHTFQNSKMDTLMENLMPFKIAREIKEAKELKPLKYALLAALSCNEDPNLFFDAKDKAHFKDEKNFLEKDTRFKTKREIATRIKVQESILGQRVQSRYANTFYFYDTSVYSEDFASRNFDLARTMRLRYLVEGAKYDMSNWFTPFNNGLESYSIRSFTGVEAILWEELLDPSNAKDAELIALYKPRYEEVKKQGFVTNLFYKSDKEEAKQLCSKLKALK